MRTLLLMILFFATVAARSQQLLTVEEAIATALQNNFDIRIARNDSLINALDYDYRNTVFLPTLNATAGTTWNNNNQRQTLADNSKREQKGIRSHNMAGSVALAWTLFDGLKMFVTKEKSVALMALGELNLRNQINNTIAQVIQQYFAIVRQKQQLKAVEEQINLNEERVKLAQYKLDIGTGAKPDVLQSKVDLNAQVSQKWTQQTLIEQQKDQLLQLMNVTAGTIIEVTDSIPVNKNILLAEVQEAIAHNNPELLLARKNIEIADFTRKERMAERWPTLTFNSVYNYSRTDNKTVINPFSPLFNQAIGFNYGIGINIPVFNRLQLRRQIKQAQFEINSWTIQADRTRSLLNMEVLLAYKDYLLQQKSLRLEEENIVLARENVDIVFQVYKLNSATLVQLREAQNSLEIANNRLIATRYAAKLAEVKLLQLQGNLIK